MTLDIDETGSFGPMIQGIGHGEAMAAQFLERLPVTSAKSTTDFHHVPHVQNSKRTVYHLPIVSGIHGFSRAKKKHVLGTLRCQESIELVSEKRAEELLGHNFRHLEKICLKVPQTNRIQWFFMGFSWYLTSNPRNPIDLSPGL